MRGLVIGLTILSNFLFISYISWAEPVRIDYEGVVDIISPTLTSGPIETGETFYGYYIIDPKFSSPNIQKWGDQDQWSQTFFEGALRETYIKFSTEEFLFEGGFVRTDPNYNNVTSYSIYTRTGLVSATNREINNLPVNSLSLSFPSFTDLLPTDYLPLELPPFDPASDHAFMFLRFTPLGNDYIQGQLTKASVASSPVPEPSSFLLLSAGLAGLAIYSRRSQK